MKCTPQNQSVGFPQQQPAAKPTDGDADEVPTVVDLETADGHDVSVDLSEIVHLLDGAEPISPLLTTPLTAVSRGGHAPGVVLLGDAAGFLDPITGGGIAQALITSERLAHYVVSHGAEHADAWLPSFERDRKRLLRDYPTSDEASLARNRLRDLGVDVR